MENKIDSCCCPRLVVHWRNECAFVGQVKTKDETVARNRKTKQEKTKLNTSLNNASGGVVISHLCVCVCLSWCVYVCMSA